MKRFVSLCVSMFICCTCSAAISQVNTIEEVVSYLKEADGETLVIFDVDMVLMQPSDPVFQMANIRRYKPFVKKIMGDVPEEKREIFLSLMTIGCDSILVDERIPQIIQELTLRKVPKIALASHLTGAFSSIPNMEEWRLARLHAFRIDFAAGAPFPQKLIFHKLPSYRGNYSTYREGVLFVNGTACTKGEALAAFLEQIGMYPKKVLFVDDREENLKNVEASLQALPFPIEYQGIRYVGARHYPSEVVSEELFSTKWKELADLAMNME